MTPDKTPEDLNDLREAGLEDRAEALKERQLVQKRRKEIEQRRNVIIASTDDGAKELLELQLEVVTLQAMIVQLQLEQAVDLNTLRLLKIEANGVWHHLESFAEGAQLKQEIHQVLAESVQKLREQVQEQDETWKKIQRERRRD